jgi:hypothetical protein
MVSYGAPVPGEDDFELLVNKGTTNFNELSKVRRVKTCPETSYDGENLEGGAPSTIVEGCGKPARPPALQVRSSRGRWWAGGLAGRGYKYNVKFKWRGTGLGAHG